MSDKTRELHGLSPIKDWMFNYGILEQRIEGYREALDRLHQIIGSAERIVFDGGEYEQDPEFGWQNGRDEDDIDLLNAISNPDFLSKIDVVLERGLKWGGDWKSFKDFPHVEI